MVIIVLLLRHQPLRSHHNRKLLVADKQVVIISMTLNVEVTQFLSSYRRLRHAVIMTE